MAVDKRRIILWLAGLVLAMPLSAQQAESKKEGGDRGVMLNAESASMPREISIGLPTGDNGATICEDGVKHSYSFVKGRYHWAGGNAYSSVGLRGLSESVIKTGDLPKDLVIHFATPPSLPEKAFHIQSPYGNGVR